MAAGPGKVRFMRRAFAEVRKNLRVAEGGPFGACLVRSGEIIAAARDFNEMPPGNALMARLGKSPVRVHPGFLRDECPALPRDRDALPGKII